jgi:hypothetical protein
MTVTYSVALPFVRTEEGVAPGQVQEMSNETATIRRAESISRDPANAGALAFKRSGDPNMGNATILKSLVKYQRIWTNYEYSRGTSGTCRHSLKWCLPNSPEIAPSARQQPII